MRERLEQAMKEKKMGRHKKEDKLRKFLKEGIKENENTKNIKDILFVGLFAGLVTYSYKYLVEIN